MLLCCPGQGLCCAAVTLSGVSSRTVSALRQEALHGAPALGNGHTPLTMLDNALKYVLSLRMAYVSHFGF